MHPGSANVHRAHAPKSARSGTYVASAALAALVAAMPSLAANVKADIDNRNGSIAAFDGGSGDPAEFSFVIDPRIEYQPLEINQTTQVANRVAHLVHSSQWFGTDPASSTTGITITESYNVSKPSGPGYAIGNESTQVSFTVTDAPGGGLPWKFSGSLVENNADAVITLSGPGVNVSFNTSTKWNTPVNLQNGNYSLNISLLVAVDTNPAASKSVELSVTLKSDALAPASGVIINPANGHRYQLAEPAGWNDFVAFAASQTFGGTFGCPASIGSGFENQWIRCNVASNVPTINDGAPFSTWISLNDVDTEGTFEWWCTEPFVYSNWKAGEPNNGGNSDFVELLGDSGQWQDRGGQAVEYGLVEYEFVACGSGGNCFAVHAPPGCNDESCCQTVCFFDSFCCSTTWDGGCVNEANGLCSPGIVAGPILNPTNQHNYYLLETGAWSEAQEKAESLGGYLVTINNAAENTWVRNNVSRFDGNQTRICFIGFNDQLVEGAFQWLNNSVSTYTNWDAGEPNNSGGIEHFTEMLADGTWRDNDNTGTSGFSTFAIVEVPCAADFDGNGSVDGGDLGTLLGAWNTTDKTADLNHDGVVNGADLAIVLGSWGSCG